MLLASASPLLWIYKQRPWVLSRDHVSVHFRNSCVRRGTDVLNSPNTGEHRRSGLGNAAELVGTNIRDVGHHGPVHGDQERIGDGRIQVVNTHRGVLWSLPEVRQ